MRRINASDYAEIILTKVNRKMPANPDRLLILHAGDFKENEVYLRGKLKDAKFCGIPVEVRKVKSQFELACRILWANINPHVAGMICQLPLPKGWNTELPTKLISKKKDVDGFRKNSYFPECTPAGIMALLRHILGYDLHSRKIMLIGRGKLVGRPLRALLETAGVTVMAFGRDTTDLESIAMGSKWSWDAIVVATGCPDTINLNYCNAKVVIDCGIHKHGKVLSGDVSTYPVSGETYDPAYIGPPNGPGRVTRAMLMYNVLCAQRKIKKRIFK